MYPIKLFKLNMSNFCKKNFITIAILLKLNAKKYGTKEGFEHLSKPNLGLLKFENA